MFGIEVTNVKQAKAFFKVTQKKASKAFEEVLFEIAMIVFTQSQYLVPVDTGTLRASGSVTKRMRLRGGDKMVIWITYGGPAAKYALHVHENVLSRHEAPTSAKYLEIPFNLVKPRMKKLVERKISQRLA
jgi:hypothetical protein